VENNGPGKKELNRGMINTTQKYGGAALPRCLPAQIFCGVLIFALAAMTGCVTKSQADAEARAAYLAGQKAAYETIGATQTNIVVLGAVQKHEVPWVVGLTLTQAIATAQYTGTHDPEVILLKRNSAETQIDPGQLLNGKDVPLQPGDVISVVGQ
jgi:hypothetical protein